MVAVLLLALEILLQAAPRAGRKPQAQLRVEIAVVDPSSSEDVAPDLWASEGVIGPAERRPGGGFVAAYTPTRDTFPRIVLLRAGLGAGGERRWGWLALPLSGSDDLSLRTKPETRVRVELGGKTFGPVRSDAQGNARIHVEVPPGVRLAMVRVRDAFGNATSREVDLAPPPFRTVAAVAGGQAGPAGAAPLPIEVFAVTPTGRPAARADLKVSAARGAIAFEGAGRPGVFRFSYRAPDPGGGLDSVTVRAFGFADVVHLPLRPAAETAGPGVATAPLSGASSLPVGSLAAAASPNAPRAAGSRRKDGVPEPAPALAPPARGPAAVSAGLLLRGQSNLSRASGGGAGLEVAAALSPEAFAGLPAIGRLEPLARLEGLQFAAQTQAGASPGDSPRRGNLRAFSLAAGVRATLWAVGPARLHIAALAGAQRAFDTIRIVGGPADGVQQSEARWSVLAATAAGATAPLGRGRALAELQLAFSPSRGQLQGNLGGLSLAFGYLVDFH
ncbi:MAG: hypothetical protein NVS4B10_14480 [Myxococcales bacterium]